MSADFSHEPIAFSCPPEASLRSKLAMFFGHYDLRVYVTDTAYVDIGRGSIGAVFRLDHIPADFVGCLGTVGQFCDFAKSSALFCGGEHRNEQPVNVMMTNIPAFSMTTAKRKIASLQMRESTPFSIGNAVVVSANSQLLNGCRIGDGSLIAASSLLRGDVESFSIYGGIPAKKLKGRVNTEVAALLQQVRWWEFDLAYLGNNLSRLQEIAIDIEAPHEYRKPTPRFVLKLRDHQSEDVKAQVLGFLDNGNLRSLDEAPSSVRNYVLQIAGPGPYQWVADVWNLPAA